MHRIDILREKQQARNKCSSYREYVNYVIMGTNSTSTVIFYARYGIFSGNLF